MKKNDLENLVYHFFRQLWLVLGVKLMEINSNWFSREFFLRMRKKTLEVAWGVQNTYTRSSFWVDWDL